MRCHHSRPEWTWEQWQWRCALHSPKLQHHWNLTIKLLSVISRVLLLCRGAVHVFYGPSWLGHHPTGLTLTGVVIHVIVLCRFVRKYIKPKIKLIIINIIIIIKICKIVDFAVPADHRIKLNVKREIRTSTLLENWKNYGTWRWQLYQLWLVLLAR